MLKCPSCGADNADHADFCGLCFCNLAETASGPGPSVSGDTECPTCLTKNPAGARFCDQCGRALRAPAPTVPPTDLPVPPEGQTGPSPPRAGRGLGIATIIIGGLFALYLTGQFLTGLTSAGLRITPRTGPAPYAKPPYAARPAIISSVSISADGRYAAFQSDSDNLVPGEANQWPDVFVKKLDTGTVTRVSTSASGAQADGMSAYPSISGDGRYVAFVSSAANLVSGDTYRTWDAFLKDTATGAVVRVSKTPPGVQADAGVGPVVSNNGRYVIYKSPADNIVVDDTNGAWDIFVYDAQTGRATRITDNSQAGRASNLLQYSRQAITDDGRFMVFATVAFTAGSPGRTDTIFLKDLQNGSVATISANGGYSNPRISVDGKALVYTEKSINSSEETLFIKEVGQPAALAINPGEVSDLREMFMSADGRYIGFIALEGSRPAAVGPHKLYIHERTTGLTKIVETDRLSPNPDRSISADGRYVAFTHANELVVLPTGIGR